MPPYNSPEPRGAGNTGAMSAVTPLAARALQRLTLLAVLAVATISSPLRGQNRSVTVAPGVTLGVTDEGSASGVPTLVLIPGWGASSLIWSDQAARFSKRTRVVTIDPRSQGSSTITAEGVTPRQRAKDLHEVLRRLAVDNAVLVGWSQGVQDVAAYVDTFGTASLAGVVLVDAAISRGAESVTRDPERAALLFRRLGVYVEHPREYANGMLHSIILHPPSEKLMTELASELLKTPTAIGAAMLVADLYGEDLTPAIGKLDKPTLVIASGNSPELDEQRAIAAALKDARFEVIDDAGHAVFIDQPERFATAISRFLDSLATTGSR